MIASKCGIPLRRLLATNTLNGRPLFVVASNLQQPVSTRTGTASPLQHQLCAATTASRSFSTAAPIDYDEDDSSYYFPVGGLFQPKEIGPNLVGQTASIMRVFGPGANARGLLTCGGEELARHASFDPDYERARGWIQNRAIGPAVLSPVLISGLVGALVEAAFPQSIPTSCSMHQKRPLIVSTFFLFWFSKTSSFSKYYKLFSMSCLSFGFLQVGVDVCAKIEVTSVEEIRKDGETIPAKEMDFGDRKDGYCIKLKTEVVRVQDDAVIADGTHLVWVPKCVSKMT
jgi:hypothetical protein